MALELDLLKLRVTESLLQGTIFDGKDVKSYLLSYSGGPFYVLGFYAGDVYPPVPTSIILVIANPEGELSAERIELKDITSLNMLFSGVTNIYLQRAETEGAFIYPDEELTAAGFKYGSAREAILQSNFSVRRREDFVKELEQKGLFVLTDNYIDSIYSAIAKVVQNDVSDALSEYRKYLNKRYSAISGLGIDVAKYIYGEGDDALCAGAGRLGYLAVVHSDGRLHTRTNGDKISILDLDTERSKQGDVVHIQMNSVKFDPLTKLYYYEQSPNEDTSLDSILYLGNVFENMNYIQE